mmetsp:Transcript_21967/g.46705  ORF Transcript_21967/g.46705 Transcript_21967/m.46705 type:complete len:264 (+) Transcript_21967:1081-1872(+)
MMGGVDLASVENGISQALVVILHVDLSSNTALQALWGALQHLSPQPESLLNGLASPTAGRPGIPFLPHLIYVGVVHISPAPLDHALADLLQLLEMVGSVGDHIREDLQRSQVLDDALLELHLFLTRVGVVEAEDQLTFVVPSIVVVQHRRLGMANVEVATGLRGEPGAHLALHGIGQQALQAGLILPFATSPGLTGAIAVATAATCSPRPLAEGEGGLQPPDVHEPSSGVRKGLHVNDAGDLREALDILLRDLGPAADKRPCR